MDGIQSIKALSHSFIFPGYYIGFTGKLAVQLMLQVGIAMEGLGGGVHVSKIIWHNRVVTV